MAVTCCPWSEYKGLTMQIYVRGHIDSINWAFAPSSSMLFAKPATLCIQNLMPQRRKYLTRLM